MMGGIYKCSSERSSNTTKIETEDSPEDTDELVKSQKEVLTQQRLKHADKCMTHLF